MRWCNRLPIGAQNIQVIVDIGIDDRFVTMFGLRSLNFWW